MTRRSKLGKPFMALGIALMCAALLLLYYNHAESQMAKASSHAVLSQMQETAAQEQHSAAHPEVMTVVEIDGYGYIGYLTIPALELELPIMAEWDYERLKIAPCRYTGSPKTDDFTIAAHNYAAHFGNLQKLAAGDAVIFTDMAGTEHRYQVVRLEELAPTAVEKVASGDGHLILFTCTYGGQNRVAVYCHRQE